MKLSPNGYDTAAGFKLHASGRTISLLKITVGAIVCMAVSMLWSFGAQKMVALPTYRAAVDRAIAAQSLKAAASNNADDPDVLLGLAYLAQAGDPVRGELSEAVLRLQPEQRPIVLVLSLTMDGVDEKTVEELIKTDPDNALGYYLKGSLLYGAEQSDEALAVFGKAAKCDELRLYESVTGEALLKALDALKLKGRDRLCALAWMASRSSNFAAVVLQTIQRAVREQARDADMGKRKEIAEMLMVLAGHFFSSSFNNRWYAERALESAFNMNAQIAAAEKSPTMNGYTAAIRALSAGTMSWPGIEERTRANDVARFLPNRILRAFPFVDPSQVTDKHVGELNVKVPEGDKAAFEKAKENGTNAARALIDVAVTDPDGVVGPYLKGIPPGRRYEDGPWKTTMTLVEKMLAKRPDVLKAALANEEAMNAIWKAGENDPVRKNTSQMMSIGLGIATYAARHDKRYPESLNVLFDRGLLKAPIEAKSLLTGRPYRYVAAGEKAPEKSSELNSLILLYDDDGSRGYHQCIMADGHGQGMSVEKVKEQLAARGK